MPLSPSFSRLASAPRKRSRRWRRWHHVGAFQTAKRRRRSKARAASNNLTPFPIDDSRALSTTGVHTPSWRQEGDTLGRRRAASGSGARGAPRRGTRARGTLGRRLALRVGKAEKDEARDGCRLRGTEGRFWTKPTLVVTRKRAGRGAKRTPARWMTRSTPSHAPRSVDGSARSTATGSTRGWLSRSAGSGRRWKSSRNGVRTREKVPGEVRAEVACSTADQDSHATSGRASCTNESKIIPPTSKKGGVGESWAREGCRSRKRRARARTPEPTTNS